MPAYSFEALDAQGATRKGVMEADTAKAVRGMLRAQALVPLQVRRWAPARPTSRRRLARAVQPPGLQLHRAGDLDAAARRPGLLRPAAGTRADRADRRSRERAPAPPGGRAARRSQRRLALRARRWRASRASSADIYTAVIGAGEQSGNLGLVLERLADDLEERQALKAKLLGAALYPAIVTLVAIAIVMFLVGYVVPQVANVFAGTKRALPFLTVAMLAISDFVRNWGWLDRCSLLAAAVVVARMALRNEAPRERFDAGWLKPAAGRQARRAATTRRASPARWPCWRPPACPSCKALQAAAETLSNRAMRADAHGCAGAGARGRAAGLRAGAEEALPRPGLDVRPPGRADRRSCRTCCSAPPTSSAPRCSAAPCSWPPSWSRC